MRRLVAVVLTSMLTACGVADVGTGAATAAKMQAAQAQQAKEELKKVGRALDEAQAAARRDEPGREKE